MASKAASLPENLNGSEWEPSSSKATAGDDLAISSIEKLDGIESFLTPLSEEAMEKADVLLKAWEEASNFTVDPHSIQGWLEKSTSDPPPLTTEICHTLATPLHTALHEETVSQVPRENLPAEKIKEEPLSPGSEQPTPTSVDFAETPLKRDTSEFRKTSKGFPVSWKTSAHRSNSSYCSPPKSKSESPWSIHSTLCTGNSPGGETVGRQQETQSHQHTTKPHSVV